MTTDELDLTAALRDLARQVPESPERLGAVHARYRRTQRRRRAVGASAVVAAMAAVGVGAESLGSTQVRIAPAAGGPAPLPACGTPPTATKPGPQIPTTDGASFGGGGTIVAVTPSTVTIDETGVGDVLFTVTASTQIVFPPSQPGGQPVATTIDHLSDGEATKFMAVRTDAKTNTLLELVAAPKTPPASGGAAPASPSQFKGEGVVTAASPGSLTVNVTGGDLNGVITLTIHCTPPTPIVGTTVDFGGTRTPSGTYDANVVIPTSPDAH